MTSPIQLLLAIIALLLPTTNGDGIIKSHPSHKTKFYNAISREVDILSLTQSMAGHTKYEGVSYHVAPKSYSPEVEVYEGEVIWAMVSDTDEVVSKFVIGREGREKLSAGSRR